MSTSYQIVTIPDTLDDGLDLGRLDQIQQFEMNSNLEAVTTWKVFLLHHGGQKVLIVTTLDIFESHKLDLFIEHTALITETEKLSRQEEEKFVEKRHAKEWITAVGPKIILQLQLIDPEHEGLKEGFGSIESENRQQLLAHMYLGLEKLGGFLINIVRWVSSFTSILIP